MDNENEINIKRGDIVYYAQIMDKNKLRIFEILELKIRTVSEEGWFVGIEKRTKHAYLFSLKDIDKIIFLDRFECLSLVKDKEEEFYKTHKHQTDEDTILLQNLEKSFQDQDDD